MYRVEDDVCKGRKVVATKRIAPATRLLTATAHTAVSLTACNWCFVSPSCSSSLKRCSGCHVVRYCSRKCQQTDWTRGAHGKECAAWKQIPPTKAQPTVLLVARMAAKLFLCENDISSNRMELLVLRHHYEDHTADKIREFEEMAQLVLLILTRSKFNLTGVDLETLRLQWELEIVKLFCRVNCNAFSICDDVNTPMGIGMFPQAALLNHSCIPNCVVSFEPDQKLAIQVVRQVEEGEELTISYVELLESTGKRQRGLHASYFFQCDCSRCQDALDNEQEDWLLDGFLCGNGSCRGTGNRVAVQAGELATCKACGWETEPLQIVPGQAQVDALEKISTDQPLPLTEQWINKQQLWSTVESRLGCHTQSTQYANTARALANFLIDHGRQLMDEKTAQSLALGFLHRELEATQWILPTHALPSRGLLYFQLAKISAQLHHYDASRKYIRQTLAILSCAYGNERPIVHDAQQFLHDLDELERVSAT